MTREPAGGDRATASLPLFARLLNAARFSRSIAQGVLAADFVLYLRSLHWSGGEIGAVLAMSLVFSVFLTVAAGIPSDRYGRKPFVLAYDGLYVLACLAAIVSKSHGVLAAAAIVGGFGRGANGVAGPFGDIEKAWITQSPNARTWSHALNLNSTLGFLGMALGCASAALPGLFPRDAGGGLDYQLVFPIALTAAMVSFCCLAIAEDRHAEIVDAVPGRNEPEMRRLENRNLRRLSSVNMLNGMGIGLVGPLTSYWFAAKFGVGPKHIGPMMAAGFLLAAFSAHISAAFTVRFGLIPVIVGQRGAAVLALLALPFTSSLGAATTMYLLFNTLNRASNGPRATMTAALVRNRRRGLAGTISSVSRQIPQSLGPVLAGLMYDAGLFATPFLAAAAFHAGYLYLYYRHFGEHDPLRTEAKSATPWNPEPAYDPKN